MNQYSWMNYAINEAKIALELREVPVGCVIIIYLNKKERNNKIDTKPFIIAKGRNQVNVSGNASRHAEIVAIDLLFDKWESARSKKNHALLFEEQILANYEGFHDLMADCQLFVTCEPCIMCTKALSIAKIGKIVFGCKNEKFGGCGSVVNVDPSLKIESGIMKQEAINLFRSFYDRPNPQSKPELLIQEKTRKQK